jgi:predicted nucleic acid-binding protein
MKVVSNTSPICYLLLINQIHLLPALFSEVVVPKAVSSELAAESAPSLLRKWIAQPPAWLRIESVTIGSDPLLSRLHAGEQEAIMLAQQISADLIILDE